MKQKITVTENGRWFVLNDTGVPIPWEGIQSEIYGALYKLHDYKKLGYSPEELEKLISAAEWLTEQMKGR